MIAARSGRARDRRNSSVISRSIGCVTTRRTSTPNESIALSTTAAAA